MVCSELLCCIRVMTDSPSGGLDPYSSWCILYHAAKGSVANRREGRAAISFMELMNEWDHTVALGKI